MAKVKATQEEINEILNGPYLGEPYYQYFRLMLDNEYYIDSDILDVILRKTRNAKLLIDMKFKEYPYDMKLKEKVYLLLYWVKNKTKAKTKRYFIQKKQLRNLRKIKNGS